MLSVFPRNDFSKRVLLSFQDDKILREAFGRIPIPNQFAAGKELITGLQTREFWIACDCIAQNPEHTDAQKLEHTPLIFPISGGFIRRQNQRKSIHHADECVFARDAKEQIELVKSYRRATSKNPRKKNLYQLASSFEASNVSASGGFARVSTLSRRPKIARLLYELLSASTLNKILFSDETDAEIESQKEKVRLASREFFIGDGKRLSDWLALSLSEFQNLKNKIDCESSDWGRQRPQGVFIEVFKKIKDYKLIPFKVDKIPIPINGKVSIFGESLKIDESLDESRSPYLVISLLAKKTAQDMEASIVGVYAHPVVSLSRWMLVDSDLERSTFRQIIRCRTWVQKTFGIEIDIQKPLFDMGPDLPVIDNEVECVDVASREVCIPDFVLSCRGEKIKRSTIVIETMGYKDEEYRARKARLRPLFEAFNREPHGGPTLVIEHDPSRYRDLAESNDALWNEIKRAIV
ncbi:MAG: hypothetical protein ACK5XB_12485 [Rhodospirillales bacterium]